jgi:hypothetical protein
VLSGYRLNAQEAIPEEENTRSQAVPASKEGGAFGAYKMDKTPTQAVPASGVKQGGSSFGQFSMQKAQASVNAGAKPSAFGGFKMNKGGEQAVPATGGSKFGN